MESFNARPRLSLAAFLGVFTFTAIGIAAFVLRTRPIVSVLSTATHLIIFFAFVVMLLTDRPRRPFWTGFVVVSLGYNFLLGGGLPGDEFYSVPAVVAEWAAGPKDVYFDWSQYDRVPYDAMSRPTRDDYLRDATRNRIRYIANCMTAIYLGVIGGYIGQRVAWKAARRSRAAT
ncbi:MAG: hypothetical protein KJ000_12570 [Pirellulaceae bacterium]|nr:hypothetical protein [Pirellulaceae bacterium]